MSKDGIRMFLWLVAISFLVTGCAGGKKLKQEINLLKTQVGGLTTEVSRISEEQRLSQDAIKEEEERRNQLEAQLTGLQGGAGRGAQAGFSTQAGVYRTPSGFELQATKIQKALKNAGYYNGTVDGKVGTGTIDAIRRFQSDNGLDPDGVCGRKTWAKLSGYSEGAVK